MTSRVLSVVALTLAALVLGTSFAHVLEWPAKLAYDGPLYLRLQTSLYAQWGPPGIGGFLEPLAIAAVLALAIRWRAPRRARRLVVAALVCLALAFPIVFFWRVAPANEAFRHAVSAGLPPDWTAWRMRWESGHALRFALHLSAFVLLASALARGTRPVMRKV
jgi:hypothetical protein